MTETKINLKQVSKKDFNVTTEKLQINVVSYMLDYFFKEGRIDALKMAVEYANQYQLEPCIQAFKKCKYDVLLEKYADRTHVTKAEIRVTQRGSRYSKDEYVYNKDINKFGVVYGYYLSNDKQRARFKVILPTDQRVSSLENAMDLKTTDWYEDSNLEFFSSISELKAFINHLKK